MPRFDVQKLCDLLIEEDITMVLMVPPAINAVCQAAEAGIFPKNHKIRWIKSGAAPLAPELARRMTDLTGIIVNQGYGMTEASPVTHVGYNKPPEMNRPASIGRPLAFTECRVVGADGNDVAPGEAGELAMRGPQFMMGYWKILKPRPPFFAMAGISRATSCGATRTASTTFSTAAKR